ncbi:MAG: hypothetical protein LBN27_08720 [Prevotellaceae bacterium]|jgi:hypothetical protein|nr:hypothetical protein [Prevotellaceae bacterium]
MAERYKVTIEEDDNNGFLFGIIAVGAVIAGIVWVIGQIWWALLIIGAGVAIYKYNKKQKILAPTRCPKCNKNNALEYIKTEIVSQKPIKMTIVSKGNKHITDSVSIIEYTHRKYEKCKFCDTLSFTDTVKQS